MIDLIPAARTLDSSVDCRAAGISLISRAAATPTLRAYQSALRAAGIRRGYFLRSRRALRTAGPSHGASRAVGSTRLRDRASAAPVRCAAVSFSVTMRRYSRGEQCPAPSCGYDEESFRMPQDQAAWS